jgi:hypothetical protein
MRDTHFSGTIGAWPIVVYSVSVGGGPKEKALVPDHYEHNKVSDTDHLYSTSHRHLDVTARNT